MTYINDIWIPCMNETRVWLVSVMSHVWIHHSSICVTILYCIWTRSCVQHVSFICVAWLIYMRDMIHLYSCYSSCCTCECKWIMSMNHVTHTHLYESRNHIYTHAITFTRI